jgi:N-acetylglucosaminyldiphosphoundecaprenol N-acetyl-beta-D-mannosaminyltransferase
MHAAAREQLRVFFLGGEDDAAHIAAERLAGEHPGLEIFVHEPPKAPLDAMNDTKILRLIDEAEPHILLVAFGHPKQEKWIYRNRAHLPMVATGVGCSFDLIAGRRSRAPRWMQRTGFEWGYRLAHEPRRLMRRYAADGLWAVTTLLPWALSRRAAQRTATSGVCT